MKKECGRLGNVVGIFYYDSYDNLCFIKSMCLTKDQLRFGGKNIVKKRDNSNNWFHKRF